MENIIVISIIIFILFLIFRKSSQKKHLEKKIPPNNLFNYLKNNLNESITKYDNDYTISDKIVEPDDMWVPYGKEVIVGNYKIPGGLIYVGQGLKAVQIVGYYSNEIEPALIDPNLPIDKNAIDDNKIRAGQLWPSYNTFNPKMRADYLEWLANGRTDPNVNKWCVWLFFCGLERRLLYDSKKSMSALNEADLMINEVKKLFDIYGNTFFHNRTIEFTLLVYYDILKKDLLSETIPYNDILENITILKLNLANCVINNKPISGRLAFFWFNLSLDINLRTPAKRCNMEFQKLFEIKYNKKYDKGLILALPKKNLSLYLTYHPTNPSFYSGLIDKEIKAIPDVFSMVRRPIENFKKIADECIEVLDAYSLYIGRRPELKDNITVRALLPFEILLEIERQTIEQIREFLNNKFAENFFIEIDTSELMQIVSFDKVEKINKTELIIIIQFFAKLGFGIEPDIRFWEPAFNDYDKIILFKIGEIIQNSPSKEYSAVLNIIRLATLISQSDGIISDEEKNHVREHIEKSFGLDENEKKRISAYLHWLIVSGTTFKDVKKYLSEIKANDKQIIVQYLITIANADGYISPEEIKTLKKIYQLLELDPEKIFSDIHSTQTQNESTVSVIPHTKDKSGFAIPERTYESDKLKLDPKRLEETFKNTEKVIAILRPIFEKSEDIENDKPIHIIKNVDNDFYGLDSLHIQLVKKIIERESWQKPEFESICKEIGIIMYNAAIEEINAKLLEQFENELIIEEDEVLEINLTLIEELKHGKSKNIEK